MLIISDNKTYIIKEGESIPEEIPDNIIPFIEYLLLVDYRYYTL